MELAFGPREMGKPWFASSLLHILASLIGLTYVWGPSGKPKGGTLLQLEARS